jgi:hypothetical protein
MGTRLRGKLTVAKDLAARTGMALFHNHLIVDAVGSVFRFGSDEFVRLRETFWLEVIRTAAGPRPLPDLHLRSRTDRGAGLPRARRGGCRGGWRRSRVRRSHRIRRGAGTKAGQSRPLQVRQAPIARPVEESQARLFGLPGGDAAAPLEVGHGPPIRGTGRRKDRRGAVGLATGGKRAFPVQAAEGPAELNRCDIS